MDALAAGSLDYAALGRFDEIDDVAHLVRHLHLALDALERVGGVETALVDDAVGGVDAVDGLGGEAVAFEADEIESAVGDRLTPDDSVGRHVLGAFRPALDHAVAAHAGELVDEDGCAYDGVVVDDYLAGDFRRVAYDAVAAYDDVVRDVDALHEEVVAADYGLALGCRASVDGHVLTDEVVVADDGDGVLAPELEVLGHCAYDRAGEDGVAVAYPRAGQDGAVRHQLVAVADDDVAADVDEWFDLDILANLGTGMDVCQFADHCCLFLAICAMNCASHTIFSPTNAYPCMVAMPRRMGEMSSSLKTSVSPGTTFWRNFTASIFMK